MIQNICRQRQKQKQEAGGGVVAHQVSRQRPCCREEVAVKWRKKKGNPERYTEAGEPRPLQKPSG